MDITLERETTTQKMPELKFEWLAHLLPQEIFQEILTRLPILSLIRCTSVCKTWRSTITNQSFILAHHHSRKADFANQNETHFLLLHRKSGHCAHMRSNKTIETQPAEQISVHYDNDAFDEYPEVQFPRRFLKTDWSNEHLCVVGTCNGLVCLADDSRGYDKNKKGFFILNPTIRKIIKLPTPGLNLVHPIYDAATIGFGFDPTDNDYKVVRLADVDDETTLAEVYSLAAGSWRTLGNVSPACRMQGAASQAFVNGTLYWPAQRKKDRTYFLLAFDVGAKLFRDVSLPESLTLSVELQLSLSRDGKSFVLFAAKGSVLDIWVMKEDGMKESWSKWISLGRQGPQKLIPRGLLFRKSDQVLLSLVGFGDDLGQIMSSLLGIGDDYSSNISVHHWVSLNVVSKELKDLGSCGYQYCTANYYQESLLLLDNTNAVSYEKFDSYGA